MLDKEPIITKSYSSNLALANTAENIDSDADLTSLELLAVKNKESDVAHCDIFCLIKGIKESLIVTYRLSVVPAGTT